MSRLARIRSAETAQRLLPDAASMIAQMQRTAPATQAPFLSSKLQIFQEEFSMRQRSDYPTFSDAEIERRHKAIYGLMEQEGVDALLFYGSGRYASDIYWLSDWPSSREAYLLMQSGKEPVILMQLFNHFPMARVMSCDQRRALGRRQYDQQRRRAHCASAAWSQRRSAWSARFLIRSTISCAKNIPPRRLSISAASCA